MTKNLSEHAHCIYLALGSNLGDRAHQLAMALHLLKAHMTIHAISSIYETPPAGYLDQPYFLNLACYGDTQLSPHAFLKEAKQIEHQLGRRPTFRNAPRTIDIDIVFYDHDRVENTDLVIPHPRLRERAFVLVPLAEIAPDLVDPVSGKTIHDLLALIGQEEIYKTGEPPYNTVEEIHDLPVNLSISPS